MVSRFASGKRSIAMCDRCGQRFKLHALRQEIIKGRPYNLLVCKSCWDPDHPQLHLGEQPINDPQAVRNPRPDTTYAQSRDIQWGWNPVGGGNAYGSNVPNELVAEAAIGAVSVVVG